MHANWRRLILGTVLIIFMAAPAAFADVQEGSMTGTVVDNNGSPLPGVTVSVRGTVLQGERMAVTDAEGKFRLPLIPVGGGYEVTAFLDGFQKIIQTDIVVNIGETERVDFTLTEGTGDLGEITVTAEAPLLDTKRSAISETITYEFMEDIPTGRSYFDAMSMAAGVAGFGNVYTHGADDTDNVFLVDGVDTTDNATGTFGMNFSYEAIQEVEMKTGAFEAEYGRATGAISNVVTKSGGNEFHGAIPIYYTNIDMKRHQQSDRGAVDEEDQYEIEPGISIGGPILRDKLWFFGSYNNLTRRITGVNNFDEGVKRSEIFEEYMGKLTWQVNADNKIVGQYAANPATIDSRDSLNPDVMASAYSSQEQGGDLWKLQWTSIFTPNMFLEVKAAHHEVNLTIGPANASPLDDRFVDYNNGDVTIVSGNVASTNDINRPRDQYGAVLNYYKGEWAGEHNIKFGVEYQKFSFAEDVITPNEYWINRANDLPDQWFFSTPLSTENDGDITTAFLQDAWTFHDNWTFNLGLRWETQTQDNDVGERVYKLDNLLAPRLGVAWDINGDGRSKAYFNYGRYYDAVGTYLGQALNRNANASWVYTGDYETGDWEETSYDPPGENTTQVDPNLKPNFKDEIVGGYEFEFATDFSAGAKLIYNWQDTLIEDVIGNEDAIRSGDETVYWYYITNLESAERTYKAMELQLKKRLSNNYQFLAVYTLGEAKGSVANNNQSEGLNNYGDFAEVTINRYGYLPWDDRHYFKLNGAYHMPWGIIGGASFGWRSGRPFNRIAASFPESANNFYGYGQEMGYYIDSRGSHRLGHIWWLDLRLSKDFNIRDTELTVILDAFNVTNNQLVLSRREIDNETPNSTWGTANGWMGAGTFTLGLKYSF